MKNWLITISISIVTAIAALFTYHFITAQKIGYVKTGMVLQQYQGMIAANKQFESEVVITQGNIDTLKNRFQDLRAREQSIPSSKRAEWGYQVGLAEKEYLQYNQTAQEQLQQRQRQLSGQVLTTVNTFIQDYGKNHGYKIILGTTNDGSILYGLDQDDLTSVILEELNKNYKSPLAENKN